MFGQPRLRLRMFVGGVVVGDQMSRLALGRFAVGLPEMSNGYCLPAKPGTLRLDKRSSQ